MTRSTQSPLRGPLAGEPHPRQQATTTTNSEKLSGEETERLVRLLGVSGRRLVQCAEGWRVVARGDRRRHSLMSLCTDDVEQLGRAGRIVPSAGGYVLAPGEGREILSPDDQPAAGPWVFKAAGVAASNLGGPGFAGLAMKAKLGTGPLTLRQAMAGLRLIEDAELAGRDPTLTMNWDAAPADKQARRERDGARWPVAREAERRITGIRSALGENEFVLVWAACVERLPLRILERRYGLPRLAARKALPAALEKAADAYDG